MSKAGDVAAERAPAHVRVGYRGTAYQGEALIVEVSARGILVEAPSKDVAGSSVSIRLHSYLVASDLEVPCKVEGGTDGRLRLDFVSPSDKLQGWTRAYLNNYGRPHIVMIDDDAFILRFMDKFLAMEGYKFLGIETALSSPDVIARFEPRLLILDVMLPGVDGPTLAQAMRGNPRTAKIPLVFYSASTKDTVAAVPDVPFVEKGDPQAFLQVVRKLLK